MPKIDINHIAKSGILGAMTDGIAAALFCKTYNRHLTRNSSHRSSCYIGRYLLPLIKNPDNGVYVQVLPIVGIFRYIVLNISEARLLHSSLDVGCVILDDWLVVGVSHKC